MSSNKITITLQANTKDAKKNINDLEKEIKGLTSSIETQSKLQKDKYNEIQSALKEQTQEREKFAKRNQDIVNNTISNNRRQEESMKAMTSTLKTQLNELEQLKAKAQATQQALLSPLGGDISKGSAKQKEQFAKTEQDLINHTAKIRALRKELTEVIRSQDYQELADSISTNKKLEAEQLKQLKAEKQLYTESAKAKKQSLEEDYRLNKQGLADNQQKLEKLKSQLNQEINLYKEKDIALRKSMQGMSFGTTQELSKEAYLAKVEAPNIAILKEEEELRKQKIASMKKQFERTYELTSAQVKYNEAKKRLDGMLTSGAISQEQYNKGLATEGKLLKENKGSYESATNAVVRHLRQVETLIVSYYMLKGAWDSTIGVGINVNRTIESNTQGIAALITANTRMTTSTGQAVTNQQKFAMSQNIAAETMKKIKTAAIDTAGTFEDLIMIFQQATGQTLSMGNSMGSSIKEIIDNTIQLSKRMANIAGAIGMPLDRAREEIRSLLSGNASTDSLISTMLFGSPSQANQAINRAKAQGKDGVKKLLDEMLAPFDVLEGLMTYDIQFNRMKDAYQSLAATTTKPIFDGLTKSFASVANYLTPKKIDAIANGFEDVGNAVATVVPPLVQVATYLAVIKGGMLVWKNALPLIESATIGIVDFARGTIDAETGLKKTGTAFGRLNETFKKNAPMLAIIAAYEAYNFLIGDTIDKEKRLHEATSLKLEDIKKLSLAQAQTGLADINVGLSEMIKERDAIGKQIMSGTFGKQNAVGEWTDFGKLSKEEIQRLQSQQDTIQAQIDGMYKTKELYVAAVNVASGIQTTAKAFGDLMTEGSASKTLIGLLDQYKEPLTQAQILQDKIKKLQESIKSTEKEAQDKTLDKKSRTAKLQLVSEGEKRVKALQKELAELNKKESTKESSILNTEEKSKFALEMQYAKTLLALKTSDAIKLQDLNEKNLDEVQKQELEIYNIKQKSIEDDILKASLLEDEYNRSINVQKLVEDYNQLEKEHKLWIQDINEKISSQEEKDAEKRRKDLEKEANILVKLAGKEYNRTIRDFGTANTSELDSMRSSLSFDYGFDKEELVNLGGKEENFKELEDKYLDAINKIDLELEKIRDIDISINIKGFDDFTNGIAGMINGFADLGDIKAKHEKQTARMIQGTTEYDKVSLNTASNQIGAYANMTGAMSGFFTENEQAQKKLMELQRVMLMAQMAIEIQKQMAYGTTALAASLTLPPPASFASYAATAAMLASLGIMVGGMIGGKDKTSTSYDTLSAMTANTGTGTVLGDAEAGSNSIANSLEILSDLAKPEHNLLAQMNKSLISIDNKIGGVTTMLLRNAGFALGEGYTGFNTGFSNNVGMSSNVAGYGGAMALGTAGMSYMASGTTFGGVVGSSIGGTSLAGTAGATMPWVAGALVADKLLLDGAISGAISSAVGKISGGLFGKSSTSQSLTDSGLLFGEQLITKAKEDFEGSAFQTIATTTSKKSWFSSSSSTSYATYTEGMDEEIRNQFELILNNMYDTVVSTGDMLLDSKDTIVSRLDDFVVNLGKISLKGKSGAEMQQLISDVFGKTMDEMVADAYGTTLNAFQQVGETLSQTLSRVAVGISESEYYIKKLGTAFQDVSYLDIMETQGTVGFEALRQSIEKADESIYGMDNGVVKLIESLSGTTEELYSTYTTLNELRSQISFLGQDISGLTSSMLLGAGGLEALQDGMTSYFENFLTEQEKSIYGTNSITKEFEKLNLLLPNGTDGFTNLINSIDITTASGQELYGRLLLLSDGFAEATKNAKDMLSTQMSVELDMAELQRKLIEEQISIVDVATDKVRKLSDAFGNMSESIEDTIANLLGNTQDGQSQSRLIQDFWLKMEDVDSLRAKGIENLTETESIKLQGLVGDINSLAGNIQSSQFGDNANITRNLVSELDSLKYDLDFDNKIIQTQIVDASGNIIGVAEEKGVISDLVEQLKTYNASIESQLQIDKTLTFDDFKAGGLLGTADEIAFRQSFQAQDFSTFNDELSDLRRNLSYLSLSTTDTAKFLDDLSKSDSIGYENIKESMATFGDSSFSSIFNKIDREINLEDVINGIKNISILGEISKEEATKLYSADKLTSLQAYKEGVENTQVEAEATLKELGIGFDNLESLLMMLPSADDRSRFRVDNDMLKVTSYSTGSYVSPYVDFNKSTVDDLEILLKTLMEGNSGYYAANPLVVDDIIKLPSFAKGTSYLPSDMVIQAHQSEMIIDPQSSDVLRKYGIKVNTQTPVNNLTTNENKGIIEAINKQTEEIKKLNARMEKIELLNKDTRDNTERMAIGA